MQTRRLHGLFFECAKNGNEVILKHFMISCAGYSIVGGFRFKDDERMGGYVSSVDPEFSLHHDKQREKKAGDV